MKATVYAHPAYEIGKVDPRIFGSFVEHLGRVVYGGLYEPEQPAAIHMSADRVRQEIGLMRDAWKRSAFGSACMDG